MLGVSDFKKRPKKKCIDSNKICGESGTVNHEILPKFKNEYTVKLACYSKGNTFNCDENSLFYKQAGNRTYICSNDDKSSGKFSKHRVSILLATISDGEKLHAVIVGKAKKPHYFKGLNISNLRVRYRNNYKSWMIRDIFTEWLRDLNKIMKSNNSNNLLLLGNPYVHMKDQQLSQVKLFYLPINTTSLLQPLDQGIIKAFVDEYKKRLNTSINFELNSHDLLSQEDIKEFHISSNHFDQSCLGEY